MKKVITGLLLILLIFADCRRKSSNSVTAPDKKDTTEILPPDPPGNVQDSTIIKSEDTAEVKTAPEFIFLPQKQNLETGNIGIVYKEDSANVLSASVNICGGNNVFGVTFDLSYDSAKLKLKSVKEGDFLKSDGKQTNFSAANSIIAVTRAGQVSGIDGNGTICIIELEAKNPFDSLNIGFKNQSATNDQQPPQKVITDSSWFGGVLVYR